MKSGLKRKIAIALVLALCCAVFCGCKKNPLAGKYTAPSNVNYSYKMELKNNGSFKAIRIPAGSNEEMAEKDKAMHVREGTYEVKDDKVIFSFSIETADGDKPYTVEGRVLDETRIRVKLFEGAELTYKKQ